MDFTMATEKVKSFTKTPPDDVCLEFYGLYKQANNGDCNIDKPGVLDFKSKAKWEAWTRHKGMSQNAAKSAYIAAYEKYSALYA